jgi:putative hydrolase
MRIYADYHTHTVYSHGLGTIEDNVKIGIEKGLEIISISDHGPSHLGFGIKRKSLPKMRAEIDYLNIKYPQIKILLGIEANILGLDGSIDVFEEDKKYYDIILCGYHFGSSPRNIFRDLKIHFYNLLSKKSKIFFNRAKKLNTIQVVNALNKNKIDVLTHPGAKGPIDILEIGKAALKSGTALEINSSHGYLTTEQINEVKDLGVKFCISSDAHVPNNVGNFEKAIIRANQAKLDIKNIINAKE